MFPDSRVNVRYIMRAIGRALRRVDVQTLWGSAVEQSRLDEILMYGMDPGWRERDCPEVSLGELCELARLAGFGAVVSLEADQELENWIGGVEETLGLVPTERRRDCLVCRHPARVEIEVAMGKGTGLAMLSRVFKVSAPVLGKHRDICLAGRLERLANALGTGEDLSAFEGTVKVVDRILNLGMASAQAASEAGQHAEVTAGMEGLLRGAELRAKLTGEAMEERSPDPGGPSSTGSGPQVSVIMVPALPEKQQYRIIEGEHQ